MYRLLGTVFGLFSAVLCTDSLLAVLPAFPTGPTVYSGYIPSPGVVRMRPIIPGQTVMPGALRVQPQYTNQTLLSVNSELSAWLLVKQRLELTQTLSAPLLTKSGELIPIESGYKVMNLIVPPFAHRDESVLFHASANPFNSSVPAVVKYQTDCIERYVKKSEIHPLLKEYFLMKYINERSPIKIIPEPFFVSPPVRMGRIRTPKTDFTMHESLYENCRKSHIRYFVMETAGVSLEDIISFAPNYTMPFIDGMNVLRQILSALKIIHNLGIIHGDIHRGNVVRSLQDGNKTLLIDFGLARFVGTNGASLPEEPIRDGSKIGARTHFSHWKYGGYMTSFRDDVFGALTLVAFNTGGVDYMHSLTDAEERDDREFFISLFSTGDIFGVPGTSISIVDAQLGNLGIEARSSVKYRLDQLQSVVRSLSTVNAMPPHDTMIDMVDQILEILG